MIGMPAEPKYEYTSASSGQRQMFAASSSTQHIGLGRRRLLSVHSDCALERGERDDRGQARGQRRGRAPLGGQQVRVSPLLVAKASGSNTSRPSGVPSPSRGRTHSITSGSARKATMVCTSRTRRFGSRGQGDDRADAGGDLAVSLVLREDGDGFGVAFARRPAEHVGDGLAAEVGGEQVVGELLGRGSGEEVVAAGGWLAGRVPPAVGDAFRVGDGVDGVDRVPHPCGVLPVRSAMRSGSNTQMRPSGWSCMRTGRVTSRMSPLVRGREAWAGAEQTAGIA